MKNFTFITKYFEGKKKGDRKIHQYAIMCHNDKLPIVPSVNFTFFVSIMQNFSEIIF